MIWYNKSIKVGGIEIERIISAKFNDEDSPLTAV